MSEIDLVQSLRETGTVMPRKRRALGLTVLSIVFFVAIGLVSQQHYLVSMIALTAVVILHEFGHFLSMYLFGFQNVRLYLVPFFGGVATGQKHAVPAWQTAIVLLAGPLPGLVFGAILWVLLPREIVIVTPNTLPFHLSLTYELAMLFVLLNAMNLLPIVPLDGGRILQLVIGGTHIWTSIVFTVVPAFVFVIFAIASNMWIIALVTLLFLFTLPSNFRLSLAAAQIRSQLIGMDSELASISDEEGVVLLREAKNIASCEFPHISRNAVESNDHLLQIAKELHDRLVTAPLSRTATVIVLIIYFLSWLLPIVCSFFPISIHFVTNYPDPTQ